MADAVAKANAAMVNEDFDAAVEFYDEVCFVQLDLLHASRPRVRMRAMLDVI